MHTRRSLCWRRLNDMKKDDNDMSREDMTGTVNLFVHPIAGAAAISAIGIGLASHALGVWMGALTGAASASQRLFDAHALPDNASAKGQAQGKAAIAVERSVERKASAPRKPMVAKAPAASNPAADGAAKSGNASAATQVHSRQIVQAAMPQVVDDLKAIAGVGPKLEQVLNGLGIHSYGQIATWTGEEIALIEETLGFKGRIARDDWTGQAAALAEARTKH